MVERRIALGVLGLGRGFSLMLPTLARDPRVHVVAAADPRPEARARFAAEFGARCHADVAGLCSDAAVEAVYIATPHQFHAAHAAACAEAGKHMLIEKPMAVTIEECDTMIEAASRRSVHIVVGHSHSFDAPILAARRAIASGAYGRLRLITAFNFTDFMYRPRRPEELDTAQGGGIVFNQGAHQVDMARYLAGGMVETVRAVAGMWDQARPSEGAYTALLTFADGAAATLTCSGYAHFDSDEFCDWIGESGLRKPPGAFKTREALRRATSATEESVLKAQQGYGNATGPGRPAITDPRLHEHFGVVIASCENADLRPLPKGVFIDGDDETRFEALAPPKVPRSEVIDELYGAVVDGRTPVHSGAWGRATLEVCHAIIASSREQRELRMTRQVVLAVSQSS